MSEPEQSLDDAIRRNAEGPAKIASEVGSVDQHPLRDQIAADQYLSSKRAARKKHRGLRFNVITPPGG